MYDNKLQIPVAKMLFNPFGVAHLVTNLIAGIHFWSWNEKRIIEASQLQYYNTQLASQVYHKTVFIREFFIHWHL